MLRILGEFVSIFWLLGLIVGLDGYLDLLAAGAIVLLALDCFLEHAHTGPRRLTRESFIL